MLELPMEMKELLHDCLEKRRPDLLWCLPEGNVIIVDDNVADDFIDTIIYELLEVGFNHNKLNEQGCKLDELITVINDHLHQTAND